MHRLFIAAPLPTAMVEALAPAMEGGPPTLRWIEEEFLHCTLRFIGSVDAHMRDDIAEALSRLRLPAIEAHIAGVGIFDHQRRGALWARLAPRDPLRHQHDKLDQMLVRLGLLPERRAYLPHVTLARWSGGAIDPRGWAERHAGLSSAPMRLFPATLFESHLSRHGPTYTALATCSPL